jgi:FkbM family methyltransferase
MIETIHWHTLHPRYLGPDSKVLDLGANRGEFTSAITQRFACHCVAVEPTPELFARLPEGPKISRIQAAVAGASGVMPFYISSQSVASSLQGSATSDKNVVDVQVLSLADLLDRIAWSRVDLLKVDIEGAEIGMLDACSDEVLGRIAQITIEFHDFCGITPGPEVARLVERLRRVGFFSVRMSRVGHQDTWLINRRLLPISIVELLFTRYVIRNWQGLKRVVARHLKRSP